MGATIFAEMSALAARTGAVNLGQGFPDTDGPAAVLDAASAALHGGANQYAPGIGVPVLRQAIARHQQRHYGIDLDPDSQVTVTTGCTEAIAGALLGLVDPGDEVVVLEPYYDSYTAMIDFAGGVRRPVTLRAPDFRLDPAEPRGGGHGADQADPAQHPAQPDRAGARRRRAWPRSRTSRAATTCSW
ncbi:aminotransferase class I/II-fold pyridoxal phosphate-dependent enzyme [Nocardioides convexus]|uniref:aminotransferase class I/II-fold pyridoxal phosphate-dependent enzyme n=1 Tax=Nocardioides convexus TaxID=2712224 RepID=UPI00241893A7|nr:aminotransferase class I/II-fold pyridoxal phosphate-dependent enzyme [Nocardioides convexus]